MPESIQIFCDGACSGNPGKGGWGAIIMFPDGKELLGSGYADYTTNNKMEMLAAINAIEYVDKNSNSGNPLDILLTTDSQYVVKGFTDWLPGWLRNGWINSKKEAVANRDLWEVLNKFKNIHNIKMIWIKGHDGHPENEKCDKLACDAVKNRKGANFALVPSFVQKHVPQNNNQHVVKLTTSPIGKLKNSPQQNNQNSSGNDGAKNFSKTHLPVVRKATVAGRLLEGSLTDFENKAMSCLLEEGNRKKTNSKLLAVLADAIRLSREYADSMVAVARKH